MGENALQRVRTPTRWETIGLVVGGVGYTVIWLDLLAVARTNLDGILFNAWIALGGLGLGGLAGATLLRHRLLTPTILAVSVLALAFVPTGIEHPTTPGMFSLVFLFGWPLCLAVSALLALTERRVRTRLSAG